MSFIESSGLGPKACNEHVSPHLSRTNFSLKLHQFCLVVIDFMRLVVTVGIVSFYTGTCVISFLARTCPLLLNIRRRITGIGQMHQSCLFIRQRVCYEGRHSTAAASGHSSVTRMIRL